MKKLLIIICLAAMNLGAVHTFATDRASAHADFVGMTQEEQRFVTLVNQEREKCGLNKLIVDPLLIEVAREHSREMSEKSYFSHTSPTENKKTPLDRYLFALPRRPSWALVGENLFYASRVVEPERGHTALMNSDGHRANILESRFERIGVGEYVNAKGEMYITEMFLSKND